MSAKRSELDFAFSFILPQTKTHPTQIGKVDRRQNIHFDLRLSKTFDKHATKQNMFNNANGNKALAKLSTK